MFAAILMGFAALAAISASRVQKPRVPGAERRTVTEITFDNSYTSGGEAVTPADLGLETSVTFAVCDLVNGSEGEGGAEEVNPVSGASYDPDEELLHLNDAKTGEEIAAEEDMSKVVVQVVAYGF